MIGWKDFVFAPIKRLVHTCCSLQSTCAQPATPTQQPWLTSADRYTETVHYNNRLLSLFIIIITIVVVVTTATSLILWLAFVCWFVGYSVGEEPFNLAQQSGSFEVTSVSAAGDGNKVMAQVVTQPPVDTCRPDRMPRPLTIIGDFQW